MEEKQLILRVVDGDEYAFEELLKNYTPMIYKLIYSFKLTYGDYNIPIDDLYQEACVAFLYATKRYSFDRGAAFSTYAYLLIKRAIGHKVERLGTLYLKEGFSIERQMEENGYCPAIPDMPSLYHEEVETRNRIKEYLKTLSSEDLKIVELRMDDVTYHEIAKMLNISEKRVGNRLYNIKKGMRKYLDN